MRRFALATVLLVTVAACGNADESRTSNVTITNCGVDVTFDAVPERVVLLKSAAVPFLHELGVLDRVTAFMSLLEGHAEHVMDGVGPSVVPSVKHIRSRFDARRRDRGNLLDRVLRRVLGMDLKALQYAEGKRFVDAVVDAVARRVQV